jgi:acetoin:2,6-dichlorophenolindophenol oxidoreductase subunit beta
MVTLALEAAERLAASDISVEVVDPRTLMPLDEDTILESVRKTGYAIVIDEAPQSYGATAEIAARIGEKAFDYLDAPVLRIGAADLPIPFSPPLEMPTIPDVDRVVATVLKQRGR